MRQSSEEHGIPLENTVSIPEKASLSKATTINTDPNTPRPSLCKDKQPFVIDIEAQPTTKVQSANSYSSSQSQSHCCPTRNSILLNRENDQQRWPCMEEWKHRAKVSKMHRTRNVWTPWRGMTRKNKIITKVIIILLVIGIAVGVGFGVSKPLGGAIWGANKHS